MRADTPADVPAEAPAGRIPGRQPNRWKVIFVALLLVAVFGTVAWVALGSRLLVVRHVEVTGTHLLRRDQVLQAGQISIGSPMVKLDTAAVRRRVEALQQVESAQVTRDWPGTVRIVVRERTPVVVASASGGRVYEIDRYGVTVRTASSAPDGLPELDVATPGPSDATTRAALESLCSLPASFRSRVVSVEAASPDSVVFHLNGDGPSTVKWGAPERTADKLRLIEALTRTTVGRAAHTIDVSSPGVVSTQ